MKILIAVPTFETITNECFQSIYDLDKGNNDVEFKYIKGYDCAVARNKIVKHALEDDYDYTLMVDSDIVLPKSALKTYLLDPAPIVLGLYPKKFTTSHETNVFKDNSVDYIERFTYTDLPDERRFPVKGGGFGCAFIHSDVFKHLKYPYFEYHIYNYGAFLSEDLYFCTKAREEGYTIWADSTIRCGHSVRITQYD